MQGLEEIVIWLLIGLIFGAVALFYGWQLWAQARGFLAAMARLRDRIDRSRRW